MGTHNASFLHHQMPSTSHGLPLEYGRKSDFPLVFPGFFSAERSMSQVLWGGRRHCKQISLACVGSAHTLWTTLGLVWLAVFVFWVYTAQAPGCSAGELSKGSPAFHALPRSKLFRFRFSGTPQRHRLSWACVLCPSQV